ncbi:MAG: hypothetical protein LEGION0403_FIIPPAGN_01790 [Legionella sp.]|uniref:hypothetical protein n=1 Tax=Legionella sp. TaxID=459 RepID=UPI003D126071
MDYALQVTDKDINELQRQIDEKKKIQEYERLKQELHDISFKAQHTLTEFDDGMKQVDTEQTLKTKRSKPTFSELIINRIIKMCNVRPIVGNLIALGLSFIGLVFLTKFLTDPELKSLGAGLSYFIEFAAAVQILKSASRSIVLPLVATASGAVISHQLGNHLLFNHPAAFFQAMMIVGLVGIAISVFSID